MKNIQSPLIILSLLGLLVCPALGQQDLSKIRLSTAAINFGAGEERLTLAADGTGVVSFRMGAESEEVGKVTENGQFLTSEGEMTVSLDAQGYLVAQGERTSIRIDEAATLIFNSKSVLRIEAGKIVKLEASEEFAEQLKEIEIVADPGSERLVAYLLCLYLLLI